jgi:uncharacterized protein
MIAERCTASSASVFGMILILAVPSAANAQPTPPVPLTTLLITAIDYPEMSVQLQEQGSVGINYTVNDDGTVGSCIVTSPSGKARLDQAACKATNRWVFKPATVDGKPVAATLSTTLSFELREILTVTTARPTPPVLLTSQAITPLDYPEISVRLQEQGTVGIAYTVNDDGTVSGCIVTRPSFKPRLDEAACKVTSRWRYDPATLNGIPVSASASANVYFELREDQEVKDGIAAVRRGDLARAIAIWSPLAEQGNVAAQLNIGIVYAEGKSDHAEAAKWFQRAAAQNNVTAQLKLGMMYAGGTGVRRDYAEAIKWYRLAAAQNNGDAQLNLGLLYAGGKGVKRDYVEAARWYRLAAKQHVPDAMFNLAEMYLDGDGVSKDALYAYMWSHVSGFFLPRDPAAEARRRIALNRRLERAVSRDQTLRAMAMAAHCRNSNFEDCEDSATMASAVNVESIADAARERNELDEAAEFGAAVGYSQSPNRRDAARAVAILRPLAERGQTLPQTILARLYATGHGAKQDFAEAAKWYRAAAAQGSADAQVGLGLLYQSGRGVAENPLKALMWFTLASKTQDTGSPAVVKAWQLRERMAQVQIDQVDTMVVRCRQSGFKDCD